jgi:hypothetical protein
MGIYDQTDPSDASLGPNDKVAETGVVNVSGTTNTLVYAAFPSVYTVPTTGFFWLAIIQDSNAITYNVAPGIHSGYLNAAFESGAGTTLPATAGGTTNPAGPLVYVAGAEDI